MRRPCEDPNAKRKSELAGAATDVYTSTSGPLMIPGPNKIGSRSTMNVRSAFPYNQEICRVERCELQSYKWRIYLLLHQDEFEPLAILQFQNCVGQIAMCWLVGEQCGWKQENSSCLHQGRLGLVSKLPVSCLEHWLMLKR